MYCSGCGQALPAGQAVCPACGRANAVAPVTPGPGFAFELASYANKIRVLSFVWFLWGGLSVAFGFIGLAFAHALLAGRFHWWMHGPMPPMWIMPGLVHFAWFFIVVRAGLALAAGWGLLTRAPWGRIVAIIAAFVSLLKFPFGTALGIWTLVMLMGYRNTTLYDQLPEG